MLRLALAAAAATIAFACPASAEPLKDSPCGTFPESMRSAMDNFGEAPAFIAQMQSGLVVTITVNEKTGTFTVWGQPSAELTCAIGNGIGWEPAPDAVKKVAPPGKPS